MIDNPGGLAALIVLILVAIFVIIAIWRAVRIVPQAVALIVERLGKFNTVMYAGLHFLIPFVDRVRAGVDLREQVVSFPPQPVITSDNLTVNIDTVIYFQVTDPKAATYEIANYVTGIEQLTVTTLRNVIGSMDLEQTLTSRDQINGQLRGVLDEATGRWGIRVNRVELKAIDPPQSVQGAMEQQMRAERDRRAAILTAEGVKQSQILTAEGEKQSAILRAEGQAQSAILQAQGESRAILQVFDAIHRGKPDPKLLAYQYLQMLPELANKESSKFFVIPTEFTAALGQIARGFGGAPGGGFPSGSDDGDDEGPPPEVDFGAHDQSIAAGLAETNLQDPDEALAQARSEAHRATSEATDAGERSGRPFSDSATRGQEPAEGGGSDRAGQGSRRDDDRFAPPPPSGPPATEAPGAAAPEAGARWQDPPPSANQPGPTAGPPSTAQAAEDQEDEGKQ